MLIESCNDSCSTLPSEDALGFASNADGWHAWAVDGATPIGERPFLMDEGRTDAAWFAARLSEEIGRALTAGPLAPARVEAILEALRGEWLSAGGDRVPVHEWPLAAMTYVCARPRDGGHTVYSLDYADCEFLAGPAGEGAKPPLGAVDGAALNVSDIVWPRKTWAPLGASRPALAATEVERRRAKIADLTSSAVSINPQSAHCGSAAERFFEGPLVGLVCSDGFARLWNEYGLIDKGAALELARAGALRDGLKRLRAHEVSARSTDEMMKPSDDAAALSFYLG